MVDCGLKVKPRTMELVFTASQLRIQYERIKNKYWLAQSQNNVSEWGDMLTCVLLRGEATNPTFIVLDLTPSKLEPTIYRTRGEHANHYTTDAVEVSLKCRTFH